ncbi:RNA-binding protein [Methanobrevibacter sp. TMH8]|uniref:RNA-binding protein n=1 Tax=Methanobrevibacter sp. TMH8 TaxID=2848611 RepID=UPI001CC93453|nr:RNA-binding protein [Methanobrevibacter sp. TMH8]MBZ9571349.1 RNA-binding protein [Methanobrevibacter sp. TMH8]
MIHNIRYRIFVYEDEDEEKLIEGLKNILPTAKIEREIAEGMLEDEIVILSGKIDKKRETKEFLKTLLDMDKDSLEKLSNDLERKIDKNGNLFLRFSKTSACEEKWEICDTGDSIHLKIKIAAYPAKKEIAINLLNEALNEVL